MIIRVITWIIAVWVIYSLLSRYVFSLFRINVSTNDQLKQMQAQLKEMDKKMSKNNTPKKSRKEGDYVDYEEIK